ncbi:aminotransferase class IV family protein [Streptomyces albiaxialis]|uniref:Aminotransferase class IV family protein n=1 Tax=Streptomyces albiaxialis TaxID=329523 RepID=A0ABN2WWK6_9ACTN
MAYLDGVPIDPNDLQTLALTNLGHFTSMRVDNGSVRGLDLHLDRLVSNCRAVFDATLDPVHVRNLVRQAVAAETAETFVVRVTIFDPKLSMGSPGADAHPKVMVTSRAIDAGTLPPLRVQTVRYQRDWPEIKHMGLFGQLAARRSAQRAGFDDALFVSPDDGHVTEGGTWNLGLVTGHGVVWPKGEVLPGVTMRLLQRAHEFVTEPVGLEDLFGAQAVFATNTSIGVRPISAVDDVEFPVDHQVIEDLRRTYSTLPCDPL